MFLLSGEHPTLPLAELEAVLGMKAEYELLKYVNNLVVYTTSRTGERFINFISKRLALTHKIYEFTGACYMENISELVDHLPKFEMPYRVRVHMPENPRKTEETERYIGNMIYRRIELSGKKPRVSLEKPKTSIEFFINGDEVYSGIKLCDINRKKLRERVPTKRPFFKPVSLDPKIARAMVNLTRLEKGRLLDPFCGTGGILIEAGLLGFRVYGVDKNEEMVEGTKKNLEHFGLNGNIKCGDATALKFSRHFFDCVVTSPPYGRLSSLGGMNIQTLYDKAMASIENVLKPNSICVIAYPTNINLNTKMKLIEIHKERVNRSLERNIAVFKNRG